ncbi:GDP-fucose protein O-fucosyltransferase 2-like [Pollicipes pollicipes]|uniref:GDP-fucose protein O-fucosyltransferase 2-like n=1 Tax=Pollicipes pollicipes TaxID=41117 RepID=UPI00188505FD|nr:GDP-fucose protein O-fucosyltransferase 2-like [Pollicipes pollicipes]
MLQFWAYTMVFLLALQCCSSEQACFKDGSCDETTSSVYDRYLLYDVNPGEGFNLRRDVYMRVASAVARLSGRGRWTLVLPPWGPLYHWQVTRGQHSVGVPWSRFFDLDSLDKYVPVMEFDQYRKESGARVESALQLQDYAEGWRDGQFDEKWDRRPCLHKARFRRSGEDHEALMWGEVTLRVANFSCVSIQGTSETLADMVGSMPHRSVLVDRAEAVLHRHYGCADFWAVRRSMRFARHLVEEAAALRRDLLRSDDVTDRTEYSDDWRQMKAVPGSARGGPYLAVHLRRRDFVSGSIDSRCAEVAGQVRQLKELLKPFTVVRPAPRKDLLAGEEAIVDQIVCSHARHFIGSYESTFSFRIQEEREILGFDAESTFNRLCGEAEGDACDQPTRWRIEYDA